MSSFKSSLLNSSANSIGLAPKTGVHRSLRGLPIEPTTVTQIPSVKVLEQGKRGLVLFPPCSISDEGKRLSIGGQMSPITLRKSVLFWDKLEVPINNMLEVGFNTAEIGYLKSCGVVQRTRVKMYGSFSNIEPLINAHKTVFKALDEASPRAWSTAYDGKFDVFSDDEMVETAGVQVNLYNALIVPDGNIPLEGVLEFKKRRNDELLALRHYLDDVYLKIITSPDSEFTELSEIERLDRAIANYTKSIKETGFSLTNTSLQASFSLNKAAAAAVLASGAAAPLNLPLASVAVAGLLAGMDIKLGKGLKRQRSKDTPFQYISSLHREF